jgi:hypothetical protein
MALEFERGIAALKSSGGGGGSRTFTPFIKWEDGEEKFVAILNRIEDVPKIFVHEFIQVDEGERQDGSKYPIFAEFLDRTAPPIGEDEDPLTEKGSQPRERNLAVAVELEPIMGKGRNGRNRPTGFEVKTKEFKRRIFKDDEDTGKTEDVTAPSIGFIMQSGSNFFGYLGEYNESDGPHEDVPFRIKRAGGDKNTQYHWKPYEDQELDLSNVVDYIEGISYLRGDLDEIVAEITEKELDDAAAAHLIASKMLEARLEELADRERYDELTADITEVKSKFGGGKKKTEKGNRSNRKSQSARKAKDEDDPSDDAPAEESDDSNPSSNETDPEDKIAAFKRLRQKSDRNKSNDSDE